MRRRQFSLAVTILLLSLSALSATALAQSDWFWQNPLLSNLKDITYAGADTWVAVGVSGSIYRSTDGGETWNMQESGTTATLYGVCFTAVDTGVVVGEGGLILRTTDGGATWAPQTSGTSYTLLDVVFTNENAGTAVGSKQTIIHTTDGGETWFPSSNIPYCMNENFFSVSFANENKGIVGGGGTKYGGWATAFMLRTYDGGSSWDNTTVTDFCCYSVAMLDSSEAMAVGYEFDPFAPINEYSARIFKTTNGGITWTERYAYGAINAFNDIVNVGPDTWIAVGDEGAIIQTTDGGTIWTIRTSGTVANLSAVSFSSLDTGIAVGAGGIILETTDGGVTWQAKNDCVTLQDLYDIVFTDDLTAHIVGKNIRLRTYDGGLTWEGTLYNISYLVYYPQAIAFANPDTGLVAGYIYRTSWYDYLPYFVRTTNGGLTYAGVDKEFPGFDYGERFTDVTFINDTTAVALSHNIWWSWDAGATWFKHGNQVGGDAIAFSSDSCGTIVDSDGHIYRTTDRGANWHFQYEMSEIDWYEVTYIDDTYGWIVGSGGSILRTTDGGESWHPQSSGVGLILRRVFFTDPNNGTIVGNDGLILRTTDGGDTWVPEEIGTTRDLYGVFFTDSETGTAVGEYGTILRTEGEPVAVMLQQYGAFWSGDHIEIYWSVSGFSLEFELAFTVSRSSDGGDYFSPISNPDIERSGTDFILRDYGTEPGTEYIYRVDIYEDCRLAASFDTSVETPAAAFYLSQNHPNPFNPSTEIRFSLPQKERAQLRIYDVSGRLVRVLLDKKLSAGAHTARWDGCNNNGAPVVSGIYFYQLRAGKLSESKKMVLLR